MSLILIEFFLRLVGPTRPGRFLYVGFLDKPPLDSRVRHGNDEKEEGTGMTCLLQAGGIGSEDALRHAQSER